MDCLKEALLDLGRIRGAGSQRFTAEGEFRHLVIEYLSLGRRGGRQFPGIVHLRAQLAIFSKELFQGNYDRRLGGFRICYWQRTLVGLADARAEREKSDG